MGSDPTPCTWLEAFAAELEEISRRDGEGADKDRLVGLALSGSGIRSATFGLGVLETLKKFGLLKKVHYLSTVSGGSHIGAWLVANCRRNGGKWLDPDSDWSASVKHLRRYLQAPSFASRFGIGRWSVMTSWYQTVFLSTLALILAITTPLLLARVLLVVFLTSPFAGVLLWAAVVLPLAAVVAASGSQPSITVPLLRVHAWPVGLAVAALLSMAAVVAGPVSAADLIAGAPRGFRAAALLSAAALALVPAARRLATSRVRTGNRPFTSWWVQATVVIPLMTAAFVDAASLSAISAAGESGLERNLAYVTSVVELARVTWRFMPFPVVALFGSLWLLAFGSLQPRSGRRIMRSIAAALTAPALAAVILYGVICGLLLLFNTVAVTTSLHTGPLFAFVFGAPAIAVGYAASVMFLLSVLRQYVGAGPTEWWHGLSGALAMYAVGWMLITAVAVYVPASIVAWANDQLWTTIAVAVAAVACVVLGLQAARHTAAQAGIYRDGLSAAAAVAAVIFIAAALLITSIGVDAIVIGNSGLSLNHVVARPPGMRLGQVLSVPLMLLLVALIFLLLVALLFDVNEFSLNAFYRNRLVRCFLGATRSERLAQPGTEFDDGDDLPLSDSAATHPRPLHLINAAIDSWGTAHRALNTGPYVLSPLMCGSTQGGNSDSPSPDEIGFVKTASYAGSLTTGQAICISGAGQTPDAGDHPSRLVAFLMTLFNMRLGWWLPNPASGPVGAASPAFGIGYVLRELFVGRAGRSRFLRLVDGGRFDNLGMYELLRRRCRVVIVSDSDWDPDLTFAALGRALRLCEADLRVRIELDLASVVRRTPSATNGLPFAVGTITYSDGAVATLIYLKAVVCGGEETALRQYHAGHPDFPHEHTGDQFSSEDQFDSYRRLGQHVARRAFGQAIASETSVVDWDMLRLAAKLAGRRYGPPRIFISYRREDSSGYTGRLHEHLAERYGAENVFMDVDSIQAGHQFPKVLQDVLDSCDVAIIVIGRQWLTASDANGQRRLLNANDWVRLEVTASLSREILVCPVLVGGALMPAPGDLPTDLVPLLARQSFALPDASFREGLARLVRSFERSIGWN
jgi:hypothetical protein